ncbi:hypothetical protein D3C85_1140300 [compost metagenome]
MGLFVDALQVVAAEPVAQGQALHFRAVQLAQAGLAHGRLEQAGLQADHQAIGRIALAQHLGNRAFHHEQIIAVEEREVRHQPGALAELLHQRSGLFHQTAAEALAGVAEQPPGAEAVAPVAQAAVQPALLQQRVQQARDGGLGQAGEVVQLLQPQLLVLAEQLDYRQCTLHRTYGAAFVSALHLYLLSRPSWTHRADIARCRPDRGGDWRCSPSEHAAAVVGGSCAPIG